MAVAALGCASRLTAADPDRAAVFGKGPLYDADFEVGGVKDVEAKVAPVYRAGGAADKLKAIDPDDAREFPDEARREAYEVLDRRLKP